MRTDPDSEVEAMGTMEGPTADHPALLHPGRVRHDMNGEPLSYFPGAPLRLRNEITPGA
jgi:hypothetical protein